ncbi:MAG: 4Fe-4S binding protein [Clostridiales bacterium]|nr:4Fe-4S binding protein [Clostridiales bacterium]
MGLVYLKDVTTLTLHPEKCIGCELCTQVCPHLVFTMENKKARIANKEACMECGACATNCPAAAISVHSGVG